MADPKRKPNKLQEKLRLHPKEVILLACVCIQHMHYYSVHGFAHTNQYWSALIQRRYDIRAPFKIVVNAQIYMKAWAWNVKIIT